MLDPLTETKRGNFAIIYHTHIWYVCLVPRPWTVQVRHGTMGLKCVNVPRIMRVDAPSSRSIYLTISTLVVGQETNGNLEGWPRYLPIWRRSLLMTCGQRKKRNLQGHLGVCRSLLGGYQNLQQLRDITAVLKAPSRGSQKTPNTQFFWYRTHCPQTHLRTSITTGSSVKPGSSWRFEISRTGVSPILKCLKSRAVVFIKESQVCPQHWDKLTTDTLPSNEWFLGLTRLHNRNDLWMCWKSRLWWAQHASHLAGNQLRPSPLLA